MASAYAGFTWRVFLLLVLLTGLVDISTAGVRKDWDWVGEKRTLKVWVNVGAEDKLGDVKVSDAVADAMKELNAAGSDWKLENGTSADHDIEIKLADIKEDVGGAMNSFTKIDKDRKVSKRTIEIDATPKGGETWGSSGKKFDPTTVITHELIHKLRIKHQTGKTTGDSGNIADPSKPGDHQKKLSEDDKTDLKASDDTGAGSTQKQSQNAGPGSPGSKNFSFDGKSSLEFPVDAFLSDVEIGFSLTSDFETVIDPFDIPGFYDFRIIKGFLIDITGADADLADGLAHFHFTYFDTGFDLADPEYLPVDELSLRPFIYDLASGIWAPANATNMTLDLVANQLLFDLPIDDLLNPSNRNYDPLNSSTFFSFVAMGGAEIPTPAPIWLIVMGGALLGSHRRRRSGG